MWGRMWRATGEAAPAWLCLSGVTQTAFQVAVLLAYKLPRLPAWARPSSRGAAATAVVLLEWAFSLLNTVPLVLAFGGTAAARAANCPHADDSVGECGVVLMRTVMLARGVRALAFQARARPRFARAGPRARRLFVAALGRYARLGVAALRACRGTVHVTLRVVRGVKVRCIRPQVPLRQMMSVEVVRMASMAAAVLVIRAAEGAMRLSTVARVVASAAGAGLFNCAIAVLHAEPIYHSRRWLPAWTDLCPEPLQPARDRLLERLKQLAELIGPVRSRRRAPARPRVL